jgi:hypothetical protein
LLSGETSPALFLSNSNLADWRRSTAVADKTQPSSLDPGRDNVHRSIRISAAHPVESPFDATDKGETRRLPRIPRLAALG